MWSVCGVYVCICVLVVCMFNVCGVGSGRRRYWCSKDYSPIRITLLQTFLLEVLIF